MKKIPTWKLTVKEWNAEEFKTQVANLFDELNEVGGCLCGVMCYSNTDGSRRSWSLLRSRLTLPTRRTTRIR